ncbi:adenylate/guanylate cyclase domain-containing protein [Herbiconiux sp. CPCC 203407]|uniref:Adenylate/guanylate cyclase domain-containing protein n=1 Tax=Herbiconiux oxytropis TaxID=2970915 RepID=A0AA41XI37_9MICO|nr:adenylate/guanylate cyclase domain-containing protein [Herbiconiux oxytropis]MCS5724202.1 adenylate/guanylate cyclase domain-containing protein [Herbiconiux oxytropis]MCS5726794.1 adenylate/guanylate cyclase domain-containing protein [Herbiconiux oxytropis]
MVRERTTQRAGAQGTTTAQGAQVSPGSRRRGLGIQSKLLIMLLSVSIGSTLVVGWVGYTNGRDSLRDAAFDQLTNVREAKADAVQALFSNIEAGLRLDSSGATGNQAAVEFASAFAELNAQPVDPAREAVVDAYYDTEFIPALEERTGDTSDPAVFLPTSSAEITLQAEYTVPPASFDDAALVDDAGDGSAWSAVNARYNSYFREMVTSYQYEDALILDTEGNVVYSVYKGVDLGTNVLTGPYKGTILAEAYDDALNSNVVDYTEITDFERYQPSLGVPTAWGVSPIGADGVVNGVLAVQLPITAINDVMTSGEDWAAYGLGETGESYLVGPDRTMRSVSRLLIDDPEQFRELTIEGGSSPATAQRMVDVGGTVELQRVDTLPVDLALTGKKGTTVARDYLGRETLAAYTPVDIAGVQWVLVSSITSAEAFAPVDEFTRNIALAMLAIIVAVSLLSLLLAQVFARPVRTLVGAVRRVAGGDLGVEVTSRTRDEFGDLSVAFNDMSRSLQVKQQLIDEQRAETDRLLLSVMPEKVARRYREGEETIAENHQDVTVVYADLAGFDDFAAGLGTDRELSLLNDLMRQFDDAAAAAGVEKVRTLRAGYLASCGLIVPRVDSARRTVGFALQLAEIVARFNAQHDAGIAIRVGIDSGTVTSGLVGQASIAYDMWGDAVNVANRVQALSGRPGIFLTQRVRDKLPDTAGLTQVGEIEIAGATQSVWQVS